jgi:hypothetical protein
MSRARRAFSPAIPQLSDAVFVTPYIGVSTCVRSSSLLIGEGCNEFAAEGGDVWDHAAPYQVVGSGREPLEQLFAGLLGWSP